ncbi:MAG: type 1 glutamine amidotransferase [Candidatus Peribacteraceae bacterium]|nr:type 1 glutamine amidotransferase [Candidatus Peribacteraceae bacterium]
MPAPVLIIVNVSYEGPGMFSEMLEERSIGFDVVNLDGGDPFPAPADYQAMIVLGGPDSANDQTEKMRNELARIREAMDAGIPYFGACLGLQTLVKAAGGTVVKNPVREVAFRDHEQKYFSVELTDNGKKDPLMKGLPDSIPMFHLHGEAVELTPDMTLLATGKWCRNQIVRIAPRMYGMQGHLELTDAMFADWCEKIPWMRACDRAALEKDWAERKEILESTLRTLFGNFLDIAGLS